MIALLRTTFAGEESAAALARQMVEEKLAACATLAPVRSIYRWQHQIEDEAEVAVTFKTATDRAAALRARIAALHDYQLPVIEGWQLDVGSDAEAWVRDATAF